MGKKKRKGRRLALEERRARAEERSSAAAVRYYNACTESERVRTDRDRRVTTIVETELKELTSAVRRLEESVDELAKVCAPLMKKGA